MDVTRFPATCSLVSAHTPATNIKHEPISLYVKSFLNKQLLLQITNSIIAHENWI